MPLPLRVVRPFGAYATGHTITDPAEIAALLADERAAHVVQVQADAENLVAAETAAKDA